MRLPVLAGIAKTSVIIRRQSSLSHRGFAPQGEGFGNKFVPFAK
jgi:hypothetical protein